MNCPSSVTNPVWWQPAEKPHPLFHLLSHCKSAKSCSIFSEASPVHTPTTQYRNRLAGPAFPMWKQPKRWHQVTVEKKKRITGIYLVSGGGPTLMHSLGSIVIQASSGTAHKNVACEIISALNVVFVSRGEKKSIWMRVQQHIQVILRERSSDFRLFVLVPQVPSLFTATINLVKASNMSQEAW